jgi:hypothetical protein
MSRRTQTQHRRHHEKTPVERALEHTPHDLDDLTRLWPQALEQLDLQVAPPPRPPHEDTPEQAARRLEEDRQVRAERILNAHNGISPNGVSPSPLHVAALDDLAGAETALLALGDLLTKHCRGGRLHPDGLPGPHRFTDHRRGAPPPRPGRRDHDHLGYQLRLGYGMRVTAGRNLEAIAPRRDRDPALAAIAWIRTALTSINDEPLAEHVAAEVRRIRNWIRGVIGLPDLQVRLAQRCFVCHQPALRMNLDKHYVECRNPDCVPTGEQCTFKGPRGEPRWYRGEWAALSKHIGMDIAAHYLNLLTQGGTTPMATHTELATGKAQDIASAVNWMRDLVRDSESRYTVAAAAGYELAQTVDRYVDDPDAVGTDALAAACSKFMGLHSAHFAPSTAEAAAS